MNKDRSVLVLAFVGDAYFTLRVRELYSAYYPSHKTNILHNETTKILCANGQAEIYDYILPHLNEEERGVAKRAYNHRNLNTPKSATILEYKKATALEAVMGLNYFNNNSTRQEEFVSLIFDYIMKNRLLKKTSQP